MRLTPKSIFDKKKKRERIVALTAYDFPFAKIADESGVNVILVGDSLGMVLLGYNSTVPVTMREMMHHTRAVSRAVHHALVVADMPFGSYDTAEKALRNATRFLKEADADAVKLEGGRRVQKQVATLVRAGIPVMGHLGMTPQSSGMLGGYHVQGREKKQAREISEDARLLADLGAFSIVLECVPAQLARKITRGVLCPTIGIGAGSGTDGQILVLHDMLGFEGKVKPRFVRAFGQLEKQARKAVIRYREEVRSGKFPSEKESY